VTRQAAQQRFVPADGVDVEAAVDAPALPFTARATATLPAARDLALAHHHGGVGEIHLLLALLDNRSGGAIGVVKRLGLKSADVRKLARTHLGPDGPRRSTKNPPLERGTARTLDVAARESLRLGGTAVGTEHLLLALVSDPSSAAGKALGQAGLTYAGVRGAVADQAGSTGGKTAQKRSRKRA
jgi:ATP-dependent Clp protease ATP-binding subunit ClpA